DGIRDFHVTGVQTCALPIYETPIFDTVTSSIIIFRFVKSKAPERKAKRVSVVKYRSTRRLTSVALRKLQGGSSDGSIDRFERARSEERRVGKECRSRWVEVR